MSSDRCNKYPASSGYIFAVWAVVRKVAVCWQPFKSVQKSRRLKLQKAGFFPVKDRFREFHESCLADQSCNNFFLFPRNSRHLTTDLTINFACESCDEFRACTIQNWTVVGRGYFLNDSSHSENLACPLLAGHVTNFASGYKAKTLRLFIACGGGLTVLFST